jgi:hypothetical protein
MCCFAVVARRYAFVLNNLADNATESELEQALERCIGFAQRVGCECPEDKGLSITPRGSTPQLKFSKAMQTSTKGDTSDTPRWRLLMREEDAVTLASDLGGKARRTLLRSGDVRLSCTLRRPSHRGGILDELSRHPGSFIAYFEPLHSSRPMDCK